MSIVFEPGEGTYEESVTVKISVDCPVDFLSALVDGRLYYTLDGSAPEGPNGKYLSKAIDTGKVTIKQTSVLKVACTYSDGQLCEASANYTIIPRRKPVFSVPGGIRHNDVGLSISFEKPNYPPQYAEIFYTIDGSEPTAGKLKYSVPIALPYSQRPTVTIRAKAFIGMGVFYSSDEVAETYEFKCAKPVIYPKGGTYDKLPLDISITCETEGAAICYSPIGERTLGRIGQCKYARTFQIRESTTVTALASKWSYNDSDIASETYKLEPPTPVVKQPASTQQTVKEPLGYIPVALTVLKRGGTVQPFSQSKLVTSMVRAGASQQQATAIAKRVAYRIGDQPSVATTQLSGMVTHSLSKVNATASKNYFAYQNKRNALNRKK